MYRLSFRAIVEGPSDEPFLGPLLTRALAEMCVDIVVPPVDIDVDTLTPRVAATETRHEAIVRHVRSAFSWVDVVFLHVDGTSRPGRELSKYLEPLVAQWPRESRFPVLLPLVPVQEMEAWALADREVLRHLVRREWSTDEVFQGHRLGRVETLSDPKRTLADLMALRPRARGAAEAQDYLPLLGERISLRALGRVPSFNAWRNQTREAVSRLLKGPR